MSDQTLVALAGMVFLIVVLLFAGARTMLDVIRLNQEHSRQLIDKLLNGKPESHSQPKDRKSTTEPPR